MWNLRDQFWSLRCGSLCEALNLRSCACSRRGSWGRAEREDTFETDDDEGDEDDADDDDDEDDADDEDDIDDDVDGMMTMLMKTMMAMAMMKMMVEKGVCDGVHYGDDDACHAAVDALRKDRFV